ncbi:SIR2 family NAD-dependent protein deacylase [Roseimarinus sediminis]|jgi:NAD-dependent deacetylase|uniref:SIR2 family NAD-dependent protein deacylase n=1 Tax=Roseimarinus sediminis TaxID=1610899 RepID=UPI003D20BF88
MKKKLVILSGAGISQESGIKTFRDMGGLWEEYDVNEVATPQAWARNPELVMRFYNERRKQLLECAPNKGHYALAALEKDFDVHIITQNIDNLHERAGSTRVLHLHGELMKARSSVDDSLLYDIDGWELKLGEHCAKGSQLRPHVVWFGEAVPAIDEAMRLTQKADLFVVVGTSLNVYPAAGLLNYVRPGVPVFLIDPEPVQVYSKVKVIKEKAGRGIEMLRDELLLLA